MIVTLKDGDGNPVIQIRSMSDGLNYQVFRKPTGTVRNGKLYNKAGKEITADWVFTEAYCQSIEMAMYVAVEKFLIERPDEIDIAVDEKVFRKLKDSVEKIIGKLTMEVEK